MGTRRRQMSRRGLVVRHGPALALEDAARLECPQATVHVDVGLQTLSQ
jgi:hypothetical protein